MELSIAYERLFLSQKADIFSCLVKDHQLVITSKYWRGHVPVSVFNIGMEIYHKIEWKFPPNTPLSAVVKQHASADRTAQMRDSFLFTTLQILHT